MTQHEDKDFKVSSKPDTGQVEVLVSAAAGGADSRVQTA